MIKHFILTIRFLLLPFAAFSQSMYRPISKRPSIGGGMAFANHKIGSSTEIYLGVSLFGIIDFSLNKNEVSSEDSTRITATYLGPELRVFLYKPKIIPFGIYLEAAADVIEFDIEGEDEDFFDDPRLHIIANQFDANVGFYFRIETQRTKFYPYLEFHRRILFLFAIFEESPFPFLGIENKSFIILGLKTELHPPGFGRIIIGAEFDFSDHNPSISANISIYFGPRRKNN